MKRKLQLMIIMLITMFAARAQYFDKVTGIAPANNFAKAYSASWIDYNNDGLDDLIQTDNGATKHNTLYKNLGNGVFEKDTLNPIYTTSGVNTMGTSWGDYNNDGYVDLLIVNNMGSGAANHHNYLFRNSGAGQWSLVTDSPIYTDHGWALGGSMVDYDNDGWLDIFIANNDTVNFLYHNNGDGSFTRMYNTPGSIVTDNFHTYTAVWADYDNDGWQDCYVVNYFATLPGENNALYRNNHDGTFTKNQTLIVNNDMATDMSASWGDYDNDGNLDLFTTSYTATGYPTLHNYLYRNNGDGTFTFMDALLPSLGANQSYGSAWLDFNNDGKLDLAVANNKTADRHNYLYRNDGNGVFTNITTDPVVIDLLRSMGVSVSDFDNNGYPDLYIVSWSSTTEPGMYRSKTGSNNWISIKLTGTVSNRSAIGARITLWTGGSKQIREVASTTGLYCASSAVQTIGLGTATVIDSLIIRWPSGIIQHINNPEINQKHAITETVAVPVNLSLENITVGAGQSTCYNATQTITVAGNGTSFNVASGGSVTMIAGQNIVYLPGTTVNEGGYLLGYITSDAQYCPTPANPLVNNAIQSGEEKTAIAATGNSNFRIYPNPAGNYFTLEFNGADIKGIAKVTVNGINGASLIMQEVSGDMKHQISVRGLKTGIYFVKVQTGSDVQILKLIKQ